MQMNIIFTLKNLNIAVQTRNPEKFEYFYNY
jgi:hypothetical protein